MSRPIPYPCRLLLFDLDGTLVDSSEDITSAVNRALRRLALPELPPGRIAGFVGSGVQKLVARTLQAVQESGADPALVRSLTEAYLDEYGRHLLDRTRLYEGVAETLEALAWADMAVVTNKPERFSREILEGLGAARHFSHILGGDSLDARKPDPAPLLEVMKRCRAGAAETVMVGDSAVDVKAGKAASVLTCGIAAGLRGRQELEEAGCDIVIDSFRQLSLCFTPSRRP